MDDLLLYGSYGTGFRPGNVNNNLEFYAGQFEISIQDVMNSAGLDDATRSSASPICARASTAAGRGSSSTATSSTATSWA